MRICLQFIVRLGAMLLAAAVPSALSAAEQRPLNLLLITADDMNYDSLGATGCQTPDVTPNLDRLASQGMLFTRAHVTIAVCQPCRQVLMTGRYPHRNGGMGFEPIRRDVPTLGESLRAAGYFNGILAKVPHLAPRDKYCWDVAVSAAELGVGRDPALYKRHAAEFFAEAQRRKQPFFLMANAQDPHRPFAGSDQEKLQARGNRRRPAVEFPPASRDYQPDEVKTPGFLPDLPEVRREMAEYYSSVHRADETVGAVLRALDEAGLADSTLVMFLSDHGMPLPFAKTNCYLHSTRTPWIVRWPGKTAPGSVDETHFISGVDFMPTILAALDVPPVEGMDGRSFLPLLAGEKQAGRDKVFTHFHRTSGRGEYPMRSVIHGRYGYIYNAWSDGKTIFRNESQNGRTFRAMQQAAKTDPAVAERVELFLKRTPEELYDYESDPGSLVNLINDPDHREIAANLRAELVQHLQSTGDPLAETMEQFLKDRE